MSNEVEVRKLIIRAFSDDVTEATFRLEEPSLRDAIDALYEKLKDDLSWSVKSSDSLKADFIGDDLYEKLKDDLAWSFKLARRRMANE